MIFKYFYFNRKQGLSFLLQYRRLKTTNGLKSEWTSSKVRKTFVDFFKSKEHIFFPSSSILPKKHEGSYFVNSGMNQFKPIFLGNVDPTSELGGLKKVVNYQKCVRIGGKHNDLEEVGHDLYHHTFFEMLGNWSFNNSYSKYEACKMAWELMTDVFQLPPSHLFVTYFQGDHLLSLQEDLECKEIWKELGVLPNHILSSGLKDNFWSMGDTGPCGPCSEIHYSFLGPSGRSKVNQGREEVKEVWNLVFMQYDKQPDGILVSLPQHHVDTGMGLERMTSILQGKGSTYDSDLFTDLLFYISTFLKVQPYQGLLGNPLDVAYRIVSDHVRMFSVAIGDGLMPGRKESEAKLRHVMYRAMYQTLQVLRAPTSFLSSLVPIVSDTLSDAYPSTFNDINRIREIVNETEQRYLEGTKVGRKMIQKVIKGSNNNKVLNADQILGLQEGKYGKAVSMDIIQLVAKEFQILLDIKSKQGIQKESNFSSSLSSTSFSSSFSSSSSSSPFSPSTPSLSFSSSSSSSSSSPSFSSSSSSSPFLTQNDLQVLNLMNVSPTDDSFKYNYQIINNNYNFPPLLSKVVALKTYNNNNNNNNNINNNNNNIVKSYNNINNNLLLISDKTCFYAESGGQLSDNGVIFVNNNNNKNINNNNNYYINNNNNEGDIENILKSQDPKGNFKLLGKVTKVEKVGPYVVHLIDNLLNPVAMGDQLIMIIDHKERIQKSQSHTATHILGSALRRVLGGVKQQGSTVKGGSLTFDFTCIKSSVTIEEIKKVSKLTNEIVEKNFPVERKTVPFSTVKNNSGVIQFEEEVYPSQVILVSIGNPPQSFSSSMVFDNNNNNNNIISNELCGGTHVLETKQIGKIIITNFEGSIQGSKRITAVTGKRATEAINNANLLTKKLNKLIKVSDRKETLENQEIQSFLDSLKEIEKLISSDMILPKIEREELLEKIKMLSFSTSHLKNKIFSSDLAKELLKKIEINSHEKHFCVFSFPVTKLRNLVKCVVDLSPDKNLMVVSEEASPNFLGLCYTPSQDYKNINSSEKLLRSDLWAEEICKIFEGTTSKPKGKMSKHQNITLFSIPVKLKLPYKSHEILKKASNLAQNLSSSISTSIS